MKLLRRALGALALAGAIGALMRTRGRGGVPPQEGGWREVPPSATSGDARSTSGGATPPSSP